jgi:hypothetical protein
MSQVLAGILFWVAFFLGMGLESCRKNDQKIETAERQFDKHKFWCSSTEKFQYHEAVSVSKNGRDYVLPLYKEVFRCTKVEKE